MKKITTDSAEARTSIAKGINTAVDLIKKTFGYHGLLGLLRSMKRDSSGNVFPNWKYTKDGYSVAMDIFLDDHAEDTGASMVKSVCQATVDVAGDGPQPLYSKILTPSGWVKMGDLKKGDEICGTNGTIQKVIEVYPKGEKEIYKASFFDNRIVECCKDHLWTVFTSDGKKETKTVKQLIDGGKIAKNTNNGSVVYGYYTPASVVEFAEDKSKILLDPYLVGLLLGDGSLSGSGSIELSLGIKKEHIIKKIVLPEGLNINIQFVENKNSFRVKINGKTKSGLTSHKLIESIGLLGVKSATKFIPKEYLYSSTESRKKLLQGLLDTDGYINKRGLFEYSTISEQLAKDILELARGLGKQVGMWKLIRSAGSSYSDTPIYRIEERKGYKYGVKLKSITPTGVFTEMQCIKVSNPDNLYITDDYIVTHNTTLSAILFQKLINGVQNALSNNHNHRQVKVGMEAATQLAIEQIKKHRLEVVKDGATNHTLVRQIAMIASNSDEEIGGLAADAIKATNNGMITVEQSPDTTTSLTTVDGILLAGTLTSNYFITNVEKQRCELENCYIVIYDRVLNEFNDIKPLLSQFVDAQNKEVSVAQKTGKEAKRLSILIICHDCTGTALELIVTNKQKNSLNAAVIKMKDHGVTRRNIMEDIATVTGGEFLSEEKGEKLAKVKFSQLGYAKKVIINREDTIIIPNELEEDSTPEKEAKFLAHKEKVKTYVETLKKQIDNEENPAEKKIAETRYAYLTSGVAVIRVGGQTADEVKEKVDRMDDAICASRSAIKEGIVAGGGSLFLKLSSLIDGMSHKTESEREGQMIVKSALQEPFKQLLLNAGIPTTEIHERKVVTQKKRLFNDEISHIHYVEKPTKIYNDVIESDFNMGYNLRTDKHEDLLKAGVIDSAMVLRVSLENSVASATLFALLGGLCVPNR